MTTSNIYVYKCVVDDGVAPCVDRGLLSLTICKPEIRRTAKLGDYVVAFGSNSESPANRLIYAAKVTDIVREGHYFEQRKYRNRQDCIYERTPRGALRLISGTTVHDASNRPRDVGDSPTYQNAISLISNDFRYFGAAGTDTWKATCPKLARTVDNLRRGHRVNHPREIRDELLKLIKLVWHRFSQQINGAPLHQEAKSSKCHPKCMPTKPSRKSRRKNPDC